MKTNNHEIYTNTCLIICKCQFYISRIRLFMTVMISITRTDIEDLFKSLTKTELLTSKQLIEFLNDKQRDGR